MTRMAVEAAPTGSRGSSLAPSLSRITGKLFDVKRRGRKRRPNRSRRAELASRLNGKTYGANPLVERRNILAELVANCTGSALDFSEHFEGDGPGFFAAAVKHGLEGIVSKRAGSPYRSGPSRNWLKIKNVGES